MQKHISHTDSKCIKLISWFFSFRNWKNFNSNPGNSSLVVLNNKNVSQTFFNNFWCLRDCVIESCIYIIYLMYLRTANPCIVKENLILFPYIPTPQNDVNLFYGLNINFLFSILFDPSVCLSVAPHISGTIHRVIIIFGAHM